MITIIDYQAGNSTSVYRALRHLDHEAVITSAPETVREADRIIFPGVGAAGAAMESLRQLGLISVLAERIACGTPFLGICLGYQLLFERSREDDTECLGVLPGEVVRFPEGMREPLTGSSLKIPHIGWNQVDFGKVPGQLWEGVGGDCEFYFVHSYYPVPELERTKGVSCLHTEYGVRFASGAVRGALAAVQFHPEKSGRPGLRLLDNFCRWQPGE